MSEEVRERLEACAEDLESNSFNLREDTLPGDANADVYYRVADERLQWSVDLRTLLAQSTEQAAQIEALKEGLKPFAEFYATIVTHHGDGPDPDVDAYCLYGNGPGRRGALTFGEFQVAHALLTEGTEG